MAVILALCWPQIARAEDADIYSLPRDTLRPCEVILSRSASSNVVPAGVRIMPSRYQGLSETLEGVRRTGVPLVAYDGKRYKPAGFTDDPGIYYFIPALSRNLHTPLPRAISTFYLAGLIIAWVLGGAGLLLGLHTHGGR